MTTKTKKGLEHCNALTEAWRQAREAATVAKERFHKLRAGARKLDVRADELIDRGYGDLRADRLVLVDAELEYIKLNDAAATARVAATVALDAYEASTGDELSVARDTRTLHDDLAALLDTQEAARVAYAMACAATGDRICMAQKANEALAARRSAAQLPPPAAIPTPANVGFGDGGPVGLLAELARALTEGHLRRFEIAPSDRVSSLRRDQRLLRANLEAERIEMERIEAERVRDEKHNAADKKAFAEKAEQQRAAHRAQVAKQQAEIDTLEASFLKRVGTP